MAFNVAVKKLMKAPYHQQRRKVLAAIKAAGIHLEELLLDGSAGMCHSIAFELRRHLEDVGERGPDMANLGCEMVDLLDRVYSSADRIHRVQSVYGEGVRVLVAWDRPKSTRRGAADRTMLGVMMYKLGDLDVEFESEHNPIEDSDVDRAIMYYLVTRDGSPRGLGKSLTMLFLADVDAEGRAAILNLGVDTPASFYEQFGFHFVRGTYSRKRMLRPAVAPGAKAKTKKAPAVGGLEAAKAKAAKKAAGRGGGAAGKVTVPPVAPTPPPPPIATRSRPQEVLISLSPRPACQGASLARRRRGGRQLPRVRGGRCAPVCGLRRHPSGTAVPRRRKRPAPPDVWWVGGPPPKKRRHA
eukprot:EG_transcript_7657